MKKLVQYLQNRLTVDPSSSNQPQPAQTPGHGHSNPSSIPEGMNQRRTHPTQHSSEGLLRNVRFDVSQNHEQALTPLLLATCSQSNVEELSLLRCDDKLLTETDDATED